MSWRQGSNRRRPLRLHSQRLILCQSLAVSRSAGWKVAKVSAWICRGDRIVWRILLQHQHWSCQRSICSVAESRVLYLRRLRLWQVLAMYRPAGWKAAELVRRDLPRYPTEQRSTRSIVAGRVVDQRLSLRPCRLCGWKMICRNLLRCQHWRVPSVVAIISRKPWRTGPWKDRGRDDRVWWWRHKDHLRIRPSSMLVLSHQSSKSSDSWSPRVFRLLTFRSAFAYKNGIHAFA